MPHLLFLLICVIWGSNFMLMKQAALGFSGLEIAFGRVLGAAAVLGAISWRHGGRWRIERRDWLPFAFVILLGYAWPYTVQPVLVGRHGGALIGMSVSFVPILTLLLSIPLLKVHPTPRQVVGVCGALVCTLGILLDTQQRAVPAMDLLLAGSVPLGYALANICIRRRLSHVPALEFSFLSVAWTAACLLPLLGSPLTPAPTSHGGVLPLVAVVVLGTVGTGLANWMFNRLILQQGPLFAGMVTNLVPLGAVLWGWADREQVTPLQVGSLVGILAMVALVQLGAATKS